MSKLRLRISMSFDGYTSGANQSLEEPLGVGGERLELVETIAAPNVTHFKFVKR